MVTGRWVVRSVLNGSCIDAVESVAPLGILACIPVAVHLVGPGVMSKFADLGSCAKGYERNILDSCFPSSHTEDERDLFALCSLSRHLAPA